MAVRPFIYLLLLLVGIGTGWGQALEENSPQNSNAPMVVEESEESEGTRGEPGEIRFRRMGAPVIFSNFVLKTNESVRDLVVIGGNAEIAGLVEGGLVLVGGTARISGVVEGDIVIVGGAELTETARLEGEAVLVGGPFKIHEGAEMDRAQVLLEIGDVAGSIEWFKKWLTQGLLLGRLLPPGLTWPWVVAALFAAVYLGLLLVFPGAVKGTVVALEQRPVTSMAVGMLVLVLFAPLVFLLAVSVVGIMVIPFLKIAVLLMAMFGKAGVLCFIGRSLGRNGGPAFLQRLVPAFLSGLIVLTLSYMVPVVGILAWAVTSVFGLGAAVVALSSTFQREETPPPARVRISGTSSGTPPVVSEPVGGGSTAVAGAVTAPPELPGDTVLLPRAGFWVRFLAAVLDWVLLLLLVPVVGPFIVLVAVGYFVGMWAWRGTTIGSLIFGLKVVSTNGEPVSWVVALVRSLSSIFSGVAGFLGFLWAGWDREKQSWHDKIAGTVVVRMPKGFALI